MLEDQVRPQPDDRSLLSEISLETLSAWGLEPRVGPWACVLLVHAHVVPSFVDLAARLIEIGFRPKKMIVVAKAYSAIHSAVEAVKALGISVLESGESFAPGWYDESAAKMLRRGCREAMRAVQGDSSRRIILVDDGGLLTETWRREGPLDSRLDVISVQQTSSGFGRKRLSSRSPYAKIDVARSAAKAEFESRIIARGVLRAVERMDLLAGGKRIGIAGLGRLGLKLAARLVHSGRVAYYDRRPVVHSMRGGMRRCESAGELLERSEIVFGCTGQNWMPVSAAPPTPSGIDLVSCSSRDVEFQGVLKMGEPDKTKGDSPFGKLHFTMEGKASVRVHNGGFPINFNRTNEWETPQEIAITRALILGGILQALATPAKAPWGEHIVYMLEPRLQQHIVQTWLAALEERVAWFDIPDAALEQVDWWVNKSYTAERLAAGQR